MKIAIRMVVLTVVMSAAALSQNSSFAGPGVPVPPVTLATAGQSKTCFCQGRNLICHDMAAGLG